MKKTLLFIVLVTPIALLASNYGEFLTHIMRGDEDSIRSLVPTTDLTRSRGGLTALETAIRALGDEILRYEAKATQVSARGIDLLQPIGATLLSIIISQKVKDIDCTTQSSKKSHTIDRTVNSQIVKIFQTEHVENIDNIFGEDNNSIEALRDVERRSVPQEATSEITYKKSTIDNSKKGFFQLFAYAPWAVVGLWLIPALWANLKNSYTQKKHMNVLQQYRRSIAKHARIVRLLATNLKKRGATKIDPTSTALLKEYQERVQSKRHRIMLFSLEQQMYDIQDEITL